MTSPLKLCVRRAEIPASFGLVIRVTLQMPSEVSCIEEAVELMARHCFAGYRASGRVRFRLRVALSEALANAIVCGNGEDPAKTVEIRAECGADRIELHVTDQGVGFNPAGVPESITPDDLENPCGRGLFLIRNLADQVQFNERGNSICITLSRH